MMKTLDGQRETTASQVLPMQDVTKTILDHALAAAKEKIPVPERSASLEKLITLPAFHNSVKYGIAQQVAGVLAENDKFVRAVYVYEPSMNPDIESGEELPQSPTVHLLILAKSSAALQALVDSLDRSLAAALQELAPRQFKQRASVLDVNLVTEQEVQQGTGYAVLLSSLYAPPIKLWPREA